MTATMIEIENYAVELSAVPMDDIAAFVRDPIGYGAYDWSDQLELEQFTITHRFHDRFIDLLT